MLLPFVQFEYPGRLGLSDGRYVVRDAPGAEAADSSGEPSPEQVLIVQTLGAAHPDRRKRRRPSRAKSVDCPPETPEVPVTRATVALAARFEDEAEARRWLAEAAPDPERRADYARDALDVLNRGLGALREAAEDPLVHDASFHAALAMRIGYGSGEQLAEGRWSEARELPASPGARHEDLDAQRRAALELAGVDPDADPEDAGEDR